MVPGVDPPPAGPPAAVPSSSDSRHCLVVSAAPLSSGSGAASPPSGSPSSHVSGDPALRDARPDAACVALEPSSGAVPSLPGDAPCPPPLPGAAPSPPARATSPPPPPAAGPRLAHARTSLARARDIPPMSASHWIDLCTVTAARLRSGGPPRPHVARWVVRHFRHRASIDFTDTSAPVVKPGTIRTVLQLAVSRAWPVHQMDVSNAFLHGHLEEQVFCQQPTGFVDTTHPGHVCLLSRSLYGLKQAPRAWYQRIATFLHHLGFRSTRSDASLFFYSQGADTAYLLLYVDNIILTACTTDILRRLTDRLRAEFALKDLGPLHYFLGIEVVRRADGFFLHQRKYARELLDRAGMLNCKATATHVDTRSKLSATDGAPAPDASSYRSIVGAMQFLTLTRPEL
ncbi:hypothetical protein QYE76_008255 [Lolium multiflorum]|uniref:Reverse transcriptase Ty1/copia-type domain-containing protein n=1 Tax=Lolium multiflorum TaxID=4521 RepID=A0AAD8V6C7_LOLMU|nr:hypothetical protein QYE76_008255 [Lolium multiflorum]